MTAPERRRPLPALVFIGALSLLTALVWFRVLHRNDETSSGAAGPSCPATSPAATPTPTVLPIPRNVTVQVLNSTNRDGIAGRASRALARQGFKVDKAQDDTTAYGGHGLIKGVAEIRYPVNGLASATLLTFYFPHATLSATDSASPTIIVSLGAKFTKVVPNANVRKALAAANKTLTRNAQHASPSPTRGTPSGTPSC
jgi:hypothetical protein